MRVEKMTSKSVEKKIYKISSAPEDFPTFVDPSSGQERNLMRVHHVAASSEKEARRIVDNLNYDIFIQYSEPLYEIYEVEEQD